MVPVLDPLNVDLGVWLNIRSPSMVGIEITTALGSSILAFIMGLLIGIALGYIIWTDGQDGRDAK